MLHAEVFIYPGNKMGIFEYPYWGDLVSGTTLEQIKKIGLKAMEAGWRWTTCQVQLDKRDGDRQIKPCMATVSIRIHDLRGNLLGADDRPWDNVTKEISDEFREMRRRWECAPTVDEFYAMVDADLPKMAELGRRIHDQRTGNKEAQGESVPG